jgi:PIN domain nuclease of toxin-antitoxin system
MRGVIVDTHVLLWYLAGDEEHLTPDIREGLEESGLEAHVSAASIWEIAIKSGLGKLRVDGDLVERIAEARFAMLEVRADHAWCVRDLPMHHRDPFDRMLVAQAQAEGLALLTRDTAFDAYDVETLWN